MADVIAPVADALSQVHDAAVALQTRLEVKSVSMNTAWMGRVGGTATVVADGVERRLPHAAMKLVGALSEYRDAVHAEGGRPFYSAAVTVTDGSVDVRLDYDRPPDPERRHLRLPGAYVTDLEMYPRPPELVPGWMKVELAAVGAWDLVADGPRWNDRREPTGTPQSPESVGIEPPPGAEYAILPPLELT